MNVVEVDDAVAGDAVRGGSQGKFGFQAPAGTGQGGDDD